MIAGLSAETARSSTIRYPTLEEERSTITANRCRHQFPSGEENDTFYLTASNMQTWPKGTNSCPALYRKKKTVILSQVKNHWSVDMSAGVCDYPGEESSFYAINFPYEILLFINCFNEYFCCLKSNMRNINYNLYTSDNK